MDGSHEQIPRFMAGNNAAVYPMTTREIVDGCYRKGDAGKKISADMWNISRRMRSSTVRHEVSVDNWV